MPTAEEFGWINSSRFFFWAISVPKPCSKTAQPVPKPCSKTVQKVLFRHYSVIFDTIASFSTLISVWSSFRAVFRAEPEQRPSRVQAVSEQFPSSVGRFGFNELDRPRHCTTSLYNYYTYVEQY